MFFWRSFFIETALNFRDECKEFAVLLFKGHHNESLCLSLFLYFIQVYCLRRDFAQKANSRGGTLLTRAYITVRKVRTVEIYSQFSICLNRGREESVGNDDVCIVCARKYEMVTMT